MFSLSVREKFIRRVVSLSSRRLGGDTDAATEFDLQKRSLRRRWDDLLGTEKFLAGAAAVLLLLVIVQFVWIAVLQYNLYTLTEQARIQQTRIAQLEQSVKKHITCCILRKSPCRILKKNGTTCISAYCRIRGS